MALMILRECRFSPKEKKQPADRLPFICIHQRMDRYMIIYQIIISFGIVLFSQG
jgi:hypothetical protein